ncbi:methyl-accepting chemotaxis protein [Bacillus sp. BGMRC 2118]|nr:methyl-accepting chemotaxis protein [Bacillus sp. BGMRC 2118]
MKLNIRTKLLSGFMLVLMLMLAVSAVSFLKMNGMGEKTNEIDGNWMPSVTLLGNLNGDVSDIQRLLLKYVLEQDQEEMNKLSSEIEETDQNIRKTIAEYEPLITGDEEKELFTAFVTNYDAYTQNFTSILNYGRMNNFEKANEVQKEANPKWEEANTKINELIIFNQNGAKKATDESVAINKSGIAMISALSIVALLLGVAIALIISHIISKPLIMMSKVAEQIGNGDLTADEINVKNKDEIGDLAKTINTMTQNLRTLIEQVGLTAEQVAASSEELTASSEQTTHATEQVAVTMQEVTAGVDKQVKSVEETKTTIQELSIGINQISTNANQVSTTASTASEKAAEGGEVIKTAVKQMNSISSTVNGLGDVVKGLGEQSKEIGNILSVITGIAEQTNLLALNAAIEAARAGEHGRGFAVVADEVRKLAEQSASSAGQISELIASIQSETNKAVISMESATKEVQDGIEVVNTAGMSFNLINDSIHEVNSQIQEVSSSVEQMAAGTEQMVQSMSLISEVAAESAAGTQEVAAATEEQLASMEEISSSANSLSKMAENLQELISKFKV